MQHNATRYTLNALRDLAEKVAADNNKSVSDCTFAVRFSHQEGQYREPELVISFGSIVETNRIDVPALSEIIINLF